MLLRFASFILEDEGVLWRPPGPTEAGRFNSGCASEGVVVETEGDEDGGDDDDGSIGDRMVGRPWIA